MTRGTKERGHGSVEANAAVRQGKALIGKALLPPLTQLGQANGDQTQVQPPQTAALGRGRLAALSETSQFTQNSLF